LSGFLFAADARRMGGVFKFMICFREAAQVAAFENTYNDFLALIERIPNIQRRQVIHVTGSPLGKPAYYRILEIYFETNELLQQSLLSPQGQEAGGELRRFPPGSFDVMYAEVYEEQGGRTGG
jgi:hypothetical protein